MTAAPPAKAGGSRVGLLRVLFSMRGGIQRIGGHLSTEKRTAKSRLRAAFHFFLPFFLPVWYNNCT